jgi:hypothetical protein
LKKKGAASGEKKNERDKGNAHELERCSAALGIATAAVSYAAALPVSSRRY